MFKKRFSFIDQALIEADKALKTVFCNKIAAHTKSPSEGLKLPEMPPKNRRLSSALMRIDHAGEICAQALYRGQACTAKSKKIREHLRKSADEEQDHLAWCQERLTQLHAHPSFLNPFWYTASFTMGAITGLIGDAWSLGFVIETENQVETHLKDHLQKLPAEDKPSEAILKQMLKDEVHHANEAKKKGGKTLPTPVQWIMKFQSKVMTSTAYYF